jgi:hypothetical protein
MPLGRGIVEVFEAIPARIEVSGHGPTWRVTGGSFESVLAYVEDAYGDTAVLAREDRHRWWPRVTLTVTRDPELAAAAPPVASFADPQGGEDDLSPGGDPAEPDTVATEEEERTFASALEEIFAHQEQLRARRRIPRQRDRRV